MSQKGGIFNVASVQYTPETLRTLKELMNEAKVTQAMQRRMESAIKTGEPPTKPRRICSAPPISKTGNLFGMKKNYYFSKRSREQIERTGAYTTEKFRSLVPTVDREKEKEMIQNIMECGNKLGYPKRSKSENQATILTRQARLEELSNEIEDRVQFLNDMRALGQGKGYEMQIKQEIGMKLKEVMNLEKMTDGDFDKFFNKN